jgi:hypothetical protein
MIPKDIPEDVYKKAIDAAGYVTTRDEAAIVIARAILAERHRCTKIADRYAQNNQGGDRQAHAAFIVSNEILRDIKSGETL